MTLDQLKREAREEFEMVRSYFTTYDTSLHTHVIDDDYVLSFLDMLTEKTVAAVEESVVPLEISKEAVPDRDFAQYSDGWNYCRTAVLEAFAKFRGV